LPKDSWIGGAAANFITADGGVTDQAHVLVTDITDYAASTARPPT
jgi:hypothetical protein